MILPARMHDVQTWIAGRPVHERAHVLDVRVPAPLGPAVGVAHVHPEPGFLPQSSQTAAIDAAFLRGGARRLETVRTVSILGHRGRPRAASGAVRPPPPRRPQRRRPRAVWPATGRPPAPPDDINRLNVYPVPDGDTGTNMALTLEAVVAELDAPRSAGPDIPGVCKAIGHGSLDGRPGQLRRHPLPAAARHLERCGRRPGRRGPRRARRRPSPTPPSSPQGRRRGRSRGRSSRSPGRRRGDPPAGADSGPPRPSSPSSRAPAQRRRRPRPDPRAGSPSSPRPASSTPAAQGRPAPGRAPARARRPAPSRTLRCGGPRPLRPERPPLRRRAPTAPAPSTASAVGELRYEVMYMLHAPDDSIEAFKEVWAGIGDSIVVVGGDGLWNCHIHTDDVGAAIEAALDAGPPSRIRVTDLEEQVEEERWVRESVGARAGPSETPARHRHRVVAVVSGDGIGRIFRSLGVHHLVAGGQSMNPATARPRKAVEEVGSDQIVMLPNNKNIRPVAEQRRRAERQERPRRRHRLHRRRLRGPPGVRPRRRPRDERHRHDRVGRPCRPGRGDPCRPRLDDRRRRGARGRLDRHLPRRRHVRRRQRRRLHPPSARADSWTRATSS